MKKNLKESLVLVLVFLVLFSCRPFRFAKDLTPNHKEFLSEVRYIITRKEKKVFLTLPTPEREKFIEEFWKKRNPDPESEINEFKERYYNRIEEANHLFKEGGTPGWLQDRGRIYILLGPPEAREQYPTGYTFYERPTEIWYYGFFPIIFIDHSYTGDYELYPMSAQYVATLLQAQLELKPKVKVEKVNFDFNLNLEEISEDKFKIEIRIPYKNLWLVEKDNKLETTLLLNLEVFSDSKKKIWDFNEDYLISLTQDETMEALGKNYIILIEKKLPPGKYRMSILIENKTDGNKVKKTIKFKL